MFAIIVVKFADVHQNYNAFILKSVFGIMALSGNYMIK
jgi:hypothetical protein